MIRVSLILALALGGCVAPTGTDLTRAAARSVVTRAVVQRFPGLPVEPTIDCIIDNATGGELIGLASDSVTGPTEATLQTVFTIIRRPATVRCLADRGAAALTT